MNNIVYPYLLEEKHIDLSDNDRILIQRTKHEPLFSSFADRDSTSQKIILEIAESPILRQILFLKSKISYSVDTPNSLVVVYPFCMNPDYDFKSRLEDRQHYKNTLDKLEERLTSSGEMLANILSSSMADSIEKFMDDPELSRLLKSRHQSTFNILEHMKKSVKENSEISKDHALKVNQFMNSAYEIQSMTRIKEYVQISEDAHRNSLAINQSVKLPQKSQEIIDGFSRFTKHVSLNTETLCLDCFFTDNKPPFHSQVSNAKTIHLPDICERCNGIGLIHKIMLGYPSSVGKMLMPDSNWLQEIIIANSISSLNFVKEVFVHKKIHAVVNGKIEKGIESDITIITKDNKLILCEVTTQSDTNNIINEISKKAKNLEEAKIPYEKMIYFTSNDLPTFITVDPSKTRIFGIRHLYDIEGFVKHWIVPEQAENKSQIVSA